MNKMYRPVTYFIQSSVSDCLLILCVDIDSLYDVNKEVAGVADWFHLGLSLGLEYTTLEKNEKNNHGDVDCCMTDMLAAWLQGQGTSTPSWGALVDGLASHGVNKKDIATKVAMAHGKKCSKPQ